MHTLPHNDEYETLRAQYDSEYLEVCSLVTEQCCGQEPRSLDHPCANTACENCCPAKNCALHNVTVTDAMRHYFCRSGAACVGYSGGFPGTAAAADVECANNLCGGCCTDACLPNVRKTYCEHHDARQHATEEF